MFEFLMQESINVAAPAIHHSIQWLRQWAVASMEPGDPALADDPNISASAGKLVMQIVKAIEAREGMRIADLSNKKRWRYAEELSDQLERLSRREFHVDTEVGKVLLQTLRASSGSV
jgi:hypothetical protein